MAALVAPGAPLSVLIDHGLGESLAEKLLESGVGTVEKLGSMTPEDLEAIQGIDPNLVERIQLAINSYYGQFENDGEVQAGAGEPVADEPVAEEPVEAQAGAEIEMQEARGEPVEADTMKNQESAGQAPDEEGEVHES